MRFWNTAVRMAGMSAEVPRRRRREGEVGGEAEAEARGVAAACA